ncbi:MAG: MBL fold metallo-hydrolase [Planctomycetota bacterium]
MNAKFCVLGSGSKGNAALLLTPHLQLLIDAGFPPDELAARMAGAGAHWKTLDAVLLTHTHTDHIRKRCLALLAEHGVQFFCHRRHAAHFEGGRYFNKLRDKGLVWVFGDEEFHIRPKVPLSIAPDKKAQTNSGLQAAGCGQSAAVLMRVQPIPLPHDSPPTFGFRIEARLVAQAGSAGVSPASAVERWVKLAYLADLGEFSAALARAVAGVDLLALEFNHDEALERNSGRPAYLIERVLGREGHLSNKQAAEAFRQVLEHGANGGPRVLVQLHLSQECNEPGLAFRAAQEVALASGAGTQIFSSRQNQRGTVHEL